MKNSDLNSIDYVIGIDFGHGETSAAMCAMQWQESQIEKLDAVEDMSLNGNDKVIPSAITIIGDTLTGTAFIGDAAFDSDILKQAQVHVCFKRAPRDINGENEKLMMRFMSEVYKRIRQNNPSTLTDSNHLVFIATPSGWNKSDQDLYAKMAKAAGLPIGGVFKESRAAFVHGRNKSVTGIARNIEKGAIVFDMGSSTLDFTYYSKNRKEEHGYDCGASEIEKIIFGEKEQNDSGLQLFEKKYPQLVDRILFEARKVKEGVYSSALAKASSTISIDEIIEDEELDDTVIKIKLKRDELNSLLLEHGYFDKVRAALRAFRQEHISDQKIYGVFMTGGASRMEFLKDLISECWDVDKSLIVNDNNPSLCISEGLAEVARMDLRTKGLDKGLDEAILDIQENNEVYSTFINQFGGHIYESIKDRVEGCIIAFRDDEEDWTLYGLQQVISENVQDVISNESDSASQFLDQAISECIEPVKNKVDEMIQNYANQGVNIDLSTISLDVPTINDLNLGGIMDEISSKIEKESAGWGKVIAGAAIGGVIGFIFPIIGIIGGLALLAKSFFGEQESEEEKQAKAMSKRLGKDERQRVFNSLNENWEDMCKSMEDSVYNAITSDNKIESSIQKAISDILSAYKESLKSARLLID